MDKLGMNVPLFALQLLHLAIVTAIVALPIVLFVWWLARRGLRRQLTAIEAQLATFQQRLDDLVAWTERSASGGDGPSGR